MNDLVINQQAAREWDNHIREQRRQTFGRTAFPVQGPPVLADEDMEWLRSIVDNHGESIHDKLLRQGVAEKEIVRSTDICTLEYFGNEWIYRIVAGVGRKANELFNYDIYPLPEKINLCSYKAEDRGSFGLHMDITADDMSRKLSMSIPLNDPSEYEGGALQIHEGFKVREIEPRPGCPIVFPSFLAHRVLPVTAGKRYVLVSWIRGPNWR